MHPLKDNNYLKKIYRNLSVYHLFLSVDQKKLKRSENMSYLVP